MGVTAELHVYEGQSLAQYLSSYPSPESKDALIEIARFFDRHLERWSSPHGAHLRVS